MLGRKPVYSSDMVEKVLQWKKEGIINTEVAARLGISEATLYEWKNTHIEFSEAFKKANEHRVQNVVNALYKRALGYEVNEVTKEDGKPVKEVTKHVAGDTTAQQVYLYNNAPEQYQRHGQPQIAFTQNNINIADTKKDLAKLLEQYKQITVEAVQIEDNTDNE